MRHPLPLFFLVWGCSTRDGVVPDGGTLADASADAIGADAFVPTNHVPNPLPLVGGGVGGGAIDGELNVFVVTARGVLLPNARVRVGTAADAMPLVGVTSNNGLAVFSDAKLKGPQTITATIDGHAATTWIDANGAVVTLPLTSLGSPESADVGGTIASFDQLQPAVGHYYLGVVGTSARLPLGAAENALPQPPPTGLVPANACIKTASPSTCAWKMKVRTGSQMHWVIVFDVDAKGTPQDPSDDTSTMYGYGAGANLNFTDHQVVTNEVVGFVPMMPSTATFTFQTPMAPLAKASGVIAIDVAGNGLVLVPSVATTVAPSVSVPALVGGFNGGKYDAIATAVPNSGSESSSIWKHDLMISSSIDLGPWLAIPTGIGVSARTISFAPVTNLTAAEIRNGSETVWNVLVLGGAKTFTLPDLMPDPLPIGNDEVAISGLELSGFDPMNFSVDALQTKITRTSSAKIGFVH